MRAVEPARPYGDWNPAIPAMARTSLLCISSALAMAAARAVQGEVRSGERKRWR
jgi:hypothetical protein